MAFTMTNFYPVPNTPQIPKFCITNVSFLLQANSVFQTHCSHYHKCTCATDFFFTQLG